MLTNPFTTSRSKLEPVLARWVKAVTAFAMCYFVGSGEFAAAIAMLCIFWAYKSVVVTLDVFWTAASGQPFFHSGKQKSRNKSTSVEILGEFGYPGLRPFHGLPQVMNHRTAAANKQHPSANLIVVNGAQKC